MEVDALPLERGAVVEIRNLRDRYATEASASSLRPIVPSVSAHSMSPRSSQQLLFIDDFDVDDASPVVDERSFQTTPTTQSPLRRVQSYQVGANKIDWKTKKKQKKQRGYGGSEAEARALLREESQRFRRAKYEAAMAQKGGSPVDRLKQGTLNVLVNVTSGVIAFLLSSTLAVSCASVIVGHGTQLDDYIAHFIDMNFLGTAVLAIILAWKSRAPWTLGAIDVFVVPVMGTMANTITKQLDGDMERVVPTTVVMVSLVSSILGLMFYTMGSLRVTSIANYMPYPVIAGFLSGIGAELIRNGVHMAAEEAFSMAFFTWEQQALIWPAVLFAGMARLGQHFHVPVAFSFPCLLVISLAGFHFVSRTLLGMHTQELGAIGWIFPWPADVVKATPMWYSWANIDITKVSWGVLVFDCFGYLVSLVILGALKYSVATTSLSTLFGREISPDHEMRTIGLANIAAGVLGCCGGCHYLSAMGIMKQFNAHEKVPALVCACLLIVLWFQGIRSLQYVPKFVFGGLILSVGVHFLEAYFVAPFGFLKRFEKFIVVLITLSFLVVGMLQAVGLGVIISMGDLIYRIHQVGCVHHETTGQLTRSSVDRTPEQLSFLDAQGGAVFILRLQGYLFFGTSVNILERIETRMRCLDGGPKLEFVIIDFGLVPSFDATALLNFRKATRFAERYNFEIIFCGLTKRIDNALKRNEPILSPRVQYLTGNIDVALEGCENRLLPAELRTHLRGTPEEWKRMSQLALWEHFIGLQESRSASLGATLVSDDDTSSVTTDSNSSQLKKLLPLSAYLEKQVVPVGGQLAPHGVLTDTYFICYGYINIMIETEFTSGRFPGVSEIVYDDDQSTMATPSLQTPMWTPFTTSKERLRKIGPGSIITPDAMGDVRADFYSYIATSDCVLLRLSPQAMERVESKAPHTAVAVLKMVNEQVSTRFLYANKRVTQLSSLLYK